MQPVLEGGELGNSVGLWGQQRYRVVNQRQNIESTSAGKLALAAIANANPTMNATFCP